MNAFDPFAPGPVQATERTIQLSDAARERTLPCEIWSSAGNRRPGPLIVFSHAAGLGRRSAAFLCAHLAGHGYTVAALDHSEMVAPELAPRDGEKEEDKLARWNDVSASRVPDVRFLLDTLCAGTDSGSIDETRIGIVGHSLGGWTALAVADVEPRIRAIVALAPAGASHPRPGILPVTLAFRWGRDIPTLYLVAENDSALPLAGMYELLERTPATKRMVVLRRADHAHFVENVEQMHESFRTMPLNPELTAIQRDMLPISRLHSGEAAHLFVRALTLAHLDATLRQNAEARRFLDGDLAAALAARGVEAFRR